MWRKTEIRRLVGWRRLAVGALFITWGMMLAGDARAAPPAVAPPFQNVALSEGSVPQYAALGVDDHAAVSAALLFDGTPAGGYPRVYLLVRDGASAAAPRLSTRQADGSFGNIELKQGGPGRGIAATWTVLTVARHEEGQAAGTRTVTHRDYATGQDVTRTVQVEARPARDYTEIRFSTRYQAGLPGASGGGAGLGLEIAGILPTVEDPGKLAPPFRPWRDVELTMALSSAPGEGHQGLLRFSPALRYPGGECRLLSTARDSSITLVARPYMDPPVSSNAYNAAEAFAAGIDLKLPYGWYGFDWQLECGGFVFKSSYPANWEMQPYALARPAVARRRRAGGNRSAR